MAEEILDNYTLDYEQGKINVTIYKDKPVPIYAISLVEISDNVRKVLNRIRDRVTSEITFDIVNLSKEERMDIEGQFRNRANRLDNHWPYRNIGNKVPVHNVNMDVIGSGLFHRFHFLTEPRKIRR